MAAKEFLASHIKALSQVAVLIDAVDELPLHSKVKRPRTDDDALALSALLKVTVELGQVARATDKQLCDPLEERRRVCQEFFQDELIQPIEVLERNLRDVLANWIEKQGEKAHTQHLKAVRRLENKYDSLMNQANQAEKKGRLVRATELREQAANLMPSLFEASGGIHTKLPGLQTRRSWVWEVTDEGELPPEYMAPNSKLIDEKVKALGAEAERLIPGIQVKRDTSVAVT